MQDQLNRLIEKHCTSIKDTVSAIGRLLNQVAGNLAIDPLAAIHEAEALAHQLKGSSGTAGFREISHAATALDDHLKVLCRGKAESITYGINEAIELFKGLDVVARDVTPSSSMLYKAA